MARVYIIGGKDNGKMVCETDLLSIVVALATGLLLADAKIFGFSIHGTLNGIMFSGETTLRSFVNEHAHEDTLQGLRVARQEVTQRNNPTCEKCWTACGSTCLADL